MLWTVDTRRALVAAGLAASLGCAAVTAVLMVRHGEAMALMAVGLALSWAVAGTIAAYARPDHRQGYLLQLVGLGHLLGFALSASVAWTAATGWLPWALAAAGNLSFDAGFAALALAVALFPDGRAHTFGERALTVAAPLLAVAAAVLAAATGPELDLAVRVGRAAVPAPAPLPVGNGVVDLFPAMPLMVVVAVVLLARRARRAGLEERRALMWPVGAVGLLAILLLATPAGLRLFGATAWAAVFVVVASAVPFALLAAASRYRLLAVDLYVVRLLALGIAAAGVLSIFAAAVALSAGLHPGIAAALALAAVLSALPVRRALEQAVDKVVTGGRVRRNTVVRDVVAALRHSTTPDRFGVELLRSGLDAAWVRVVVGGCVRAEAGTAADPTSVTVPLAQQDRVLGAVECGPRHGGWGGADLELLETLAGHLAITIANTALTDQLEDKIVQLTASRARLVRAEEEARRRVERDLHDGVQQLLVSLLARLELLRAVASEARVVDAANAAHELAQRALRELRELVQGIHPAQLGDLGLLAALHAQTAVLPMPVQVDVDPRLNGARWCASVEGVAWFVLSEALANVVKHANATAVRVVLAPAGTGLRLAVVDDGCGFHGFQGNLGGTGLAGLRDRVEALGGQLEVSSQRGAGTTVVATLPAEERVNV